MVVFTTAMGLWAGARIDRRRAHRAPPHRHGDARGIGEHAQQLVRARRRRPDAPHAGTAAARGPRSIPGPRSRSPSSPASFAVPILAVAINPLTALLGAIAHAIYVLVYTPLKRISPWALEVGAIPARFRR